MNDNFSTALEYANRGWRVVRADKGKKYPDMSEWQRKATTDTDTISSWFDQYPDSNICIATGKESNLLVLDVDGEIGKQTLSNLQSTYGLLPSTYTVRTRTGGYHFYFTWDGIDFDLGNSAGKLGKGLDTRGNGGQVVAPPSFAYADAKGPEGSYALLIDSEPVPAPQWLLDLLKPSDRYTERSKGKLADELPETITRYGEKALQSALDNIINALDGEQNNTIFKETVNMKEIFVAGGLGADETYVKNSLLEAAQQGNHPSYRAASTVASAWNREVEPRNIDLQPADFIQDDSVVTYSLDDFGNADRVIAQHGENLAYVLSGGKSHWAIYNGKKWDTNKADAAVRAKVKSVLSDMSAEEMGWEPGDDRKAFKAHAKKSRSTSAVSAAFTSLSDEAALHRDGGDFDADTHLLNFPNGTLDTKTMKFSDHNPEDFITRIMPISYDPSATAPVWTKFLEEAIPSAEIRKMLQVLAGYTMTGRSNAKVLPWLYGPSNTGKSVFLRALLSLFGKEYGTVANAALLYQQKATSGPSESLNHIRLRRFVSMSEMGKHEFNEELLKSLTGRDEQNSRGLHQSESVWLPECVIWIASNTTPFIRGDDDATWGRFLPVEFNNVVAPGTPGYDPFLQDKLTEELAGILNWALEGLKIYNTEGLVIPNDAKKEQNKFREEADPVSQFLAEAVDDGTLALGEDKRIDRTLLGQSFTSWTISQNRGVFSTKKLFARMRALGYGEQKSNGVNYFTGIGSPFKGDF